MISKFYTQKFLRCVLSLIIAAAFLADVVISPPYAMAQQAVSPGLLNLPPPGMYVPRSQRFDPVLMKGLQTFPDDPLHFEFIVDSGDGNPQKDEIKAESLKLIKYFLAALTIPEKDLWVNLSPYEENRIIPSAFGETEMGRDLLAQDYLLKQLSVSLIHPDKRLGADFWDRVYEKIYEETGQTTVPMDTFHKIWVIPDTVEVYEHNNSAFVLKSHLKVMTEEDFLAMDYTRNHNVFGEQAREAQDAASKLSSQAVRDIILPIVEDEVNNGKNFAQLRQIYDAVILSAWFKKRLKESFMGRIFVDQKKIVGVDVQDKDIKKKIYQQYMEAYKKGVYNYVREEFDPYTSTIIPRKYFAGGMEPGQMLVNGVSNLMTEGMVIRNQAPSAQQIQVVFPHHVSRVDINLNPKGTGISVQTPQAAKQSRALQNAKAFRQGRPGGLIGAMGTPRNGASALTRLSNEIEQEESFSPTSILGRLRAPFLKVFMGTLLLASFILPLGPVLGPSEVDAFSRTIIIQKEKVDVTTGEKEVEIQSADFDGAYTVHKKLVMNQKTKKYELVSVNVDGYSPPDLFQVSKDLNQVLQFTDPFLDVQELDALKAFLFGTLFTESGDLIYKIQMGGGPARGYAQVEPWTALDLMITHYQIIFPFFDLIGIPYDQTFKSNLSAIKHEYDTKIYNSRTYAGRVSYLKSKAVSVLGLDKKLMNNLYAIFIARLKYSDRAKYKGLNLPRTDADMSNLWNNDYNSSFGAGTTTKYLGHLKTAKVYSKAAKHSGDNYTQRGRLVSLDSNDLGYLTRLFVNYGQRGHGVIVDGRFAHNLADAKILKAAGQKIQRLLQTKNIRAQAFLAKDLTAYDVLVNPQDPSDFLVVNYVSENKTYLKRLPRTDGIYFRADHYKQPGVQYDQVKTTREVSYVSSSGEYSWDKLKDLQAQGYQIKKIPGINSLALPDIPASKIAQSVVPEVTNTINATTTSTGKKDHAMADTNTKADPVGGILLDPANLKMKITSSDVPNLPGNPGPALNLDNFEGFSIDIINVSPVAPAALPMLLGSLPIENTSKAL